MLKYLFSLITFFLFLSGNAQPWQRVLKGPISNVAPNLSYDYHPSYGGALIHGKSGGNSRPTITSFNNKGDSTFTKEINLDSLGNSASYIYGQEVLIDNMGNRLISGLVLCTPNSTASYDAFIVKYDSLGNRIFYKHFIGTAYTGVTVSLFNSKLSNHTYYFLANDSLGNAVYSGPNTYYIAHVYIQEIYKCDYAGNIVWKKRWTQLDTTYNTVQNINFGYINNPTELGDANIAYLRWDKTLSNGARIEKISPAGQVLSFQNVINYVNPGVFQSPNINLFATKDTAINMVGTRASPTNTNVGESFLIKVNKNWQRTDSVFSTSLFINSAQALTNGNILGTYFWQSTVNSTYTEGAVIMDKHFNPITYYPAQTLDAYSRKIVLNNNGGCLMSAYTNDPAYTGDLTSMVCNYDSLFNTYPAKLIGSVTKDMNANCQFDNGDTKVQQSFISCTNSQNNSYYGYTNNNGSYSIALPNGTYTLNHNPGLYRSVMCPSATVVNSFSNSTAIQNYFDTIIPNINDLKISLLGDPFWVGYNGYITAYYQNVGTQTVNATIKMVKSAQLTFTASFPTATFSGDTATFNFSNLAPDSSGFITLLMVPSPTLNFGTPITFKASIFNNLADADPSNNNDTLCNIYYGALKPSPSLSVSTSNNLNVNKPRYVYGGEEFIYKIRFQNTSGALAKDVMIVDTLSKYFDFSTFKVLKASSNYTFQLKPNGKLIFGFKNINLSDSTANSANSTGYLIFAVTPKSTWPAGKAIYNSATIYYNYVSSASTNVTINQRFKDVGISELNKTPITDFSLYPNPAKSVLYLNSKTELRVDKINFYDISGKLCKSLVPENLGFVSEINIESIESGFYIVKIWQENNCFTKKLFIQN